MPHPSLRGRSLLAALFLTTILLLSAAPVVENLSRGVAAVQQPDGKVFVSWRLLASDPAGVAFNLYRTTAPGPARPTAPGQPVQNREQGPVTVKLNDRPLAGPTWFLDRAPSLDRATSYSVRAVVNGTEGAPSKPFVFAVNATPL